MGFLAANKIGPMLNDMNVDTTFEGDNTVMMQQVAKALVDAAAKTGARQVSPPRVNVTDLGLDCVSLLLTWRRDNIATEIVLEATKYGGSGGSEAIAKAFDAQLDRAVDLGWASVDASTFDTFRKEVETAPLEWQGKLSELALLYGMSRVEVGLADFLAGGALPGAGVVPLRQKINSLCSRFMQGGQDSTALALCRGFGIPDHLLHAPIAVSDWRQTGMS